MLELSHSLFVGAANGGHVGAGAAVDGDPFAAGDVPHDLLAPNVGILHEPGFLAELVDDFKPQAAVYAHGSASFDSTAWFSGGPSVRRMNFNY